MRTTKVAPIALFVFFLLCYQVLAQKGIITEKQQTDVQAETLIEAFFVTRTGDLPEMLKVHSIRVLVVPNRSTCFIDDKGQPRGIDYDLLKKWEKYLNKLRPRGEPPVTVTFIPVTMAEMGDALVDGRGDVAGLMLITPEREARFAFTTPIYDNIKEVVVTHKGGPVIAKLEDLSGMEVYVAKGSAQIESVASLNESLHEKGLAPVKVIETENYITQENLLEMVHAGIIPSCLVLEPFARLWGKVFKDLVIHESVPVSTGQKVGWAVRKENPDLLTNMNAAIATGLEKDKKFFERHFNQYFADCRWISNPFQKGTKSKLVSHFNKQAAAFGMDWIQLMAQSFQESGLNPKARSPYGAVGIMQVLPSTAKSMGVASYLQVEGNIQAGAKYMDQLMAEFKKDSKVSKEDRFYFTLAAYNAGPGNLKKFRKRASELGYDPNKWFENVERAALRSGNLESVMYVRNIVNYTMAYQTAYEQVLRQQELENKKL